MHNEYEFERTIVKSNVPIIQCSIVMELSSIIRNTDIEVSNHFNCCFLLLHLPAIIAMISVPIIGIIIWANSGMSG